MPLKNRDFQFEEPKKYKKYSPSENSFKYPLEEKWTIDKIEKIKFSGSILILVLPFVLYSAVGLVSLFSPFLSCFTEDSKRKVRYCLCMNEEMLSTESPHYRRRRYWAKKSCEHHLK